MHVARLLRTRDALCRAQADGLLRSALDAGAAIRQGIVRFSVAAFRRAGHLSSSPSKADCRCSRVRRVARNRGERAVQGERAARRVIGPAKQRRCARCCRDTESPAGDSPWGTAVRAWRAGQEQCTPACSKDNQTAARRRSRANRASRDAVAGSGVWLYRELDDSGTNAEMSASAIDIGQRWCRGGEDATELAVALHRRSIRCNALDSRGCQFRRDCRPLTAAQHPAVHECSPLAATPAEHQSADRKPARRSTSQVSVGIRGRPAARRSVPRSIEPRV